MTAVKVPILQAVLQAVGRPDNETKAGSVANTENIAPHTAIVRSDNISISEYGCASIDPLYLNNHPNSCQDG